MGFLRESVDSTLLFRVFFSDGGCTRIITSKGSYVKELRWINKNDRYPMRILPSCFITLIDS